MRSCDRCKSDKGVNQCCLKFFTVFYQDGKEQLTPCGFPMISDLCSVCAVWFRDHGMDRAWSDFINPPQAKAKEKTNAE